MNFRTWGRLQIGEAFFMRDDGSEDFDLRAIDKTRVLCGYVVNKTYLHYVVRSGKDGAIRTHFKWRRLVPITDAQLFELLKAWHRYDEKTAFDFILNKLVPTRWKNTGRKL